MHIIIPMSGVGQRFIDAGYTVPKPLIVVDGKPMIQHVVDLTPGETKFTFICNRTHLTTTNMREELLSIVPEGNVVEIADHALGPVYTVLQAIDQIDDDEEVIISHCDFGTYWDYNDFLKHTRERDADGAIPSYKGFHPHMLGTTNYAFMRDDRQWMLEIKEKEPFTDERMSEYASNGTYYFKKGSYIKEYFNELIDKNISVNGEFFISLVYNLLKRDNLKVSIFEIQHMIQWGIPRDVENYNIWSTYFKYVVSQPADLSELKSDINLIPIMDQDKLFLEAGFDGPKSLVDVSGRPMILEAARYLPVGDKNIFVCADKNLDSHVLEKEVAKEFEAFQVVNIENSTHSMAGVCFLGLEGVDEAASLQINAPDNGVLFHPENYQNLLKDERVDVIVWTCRHYRYSEEHSERFDWAAVDQDMLKNISIKKKISDDPYNDHVVTGTFYFRKVKYFKETYESLKETHSSNNSDLSIEDVVNRMITMGFNVRVFEVNDYVSWKIPDELKTFQYWQSFFHKVEWHPYALNRDLTVKAEQVEHLDKKYRDFKQAYR